MQFFNNFKKLFLIILFYQLKNCHAHKERSYILSDFKIETSSVIGIVNFLNTQKMLENKYFSENDENMQSQLIAVKSALSGMKKVDKFSTFNGLEEKLKYLNFFYNDSISCLASEFCPKDIKNQWIQEITNSSKKFQETLTSIIKMTEIDPAFRPLAIIDYFKSSLFGKSNCGKKISIQVIMNNLISYAVILILQQYGLVSLVFQRLYDHMKNKRKNITEAEKLRNDIEPILDNLILTSHKIVRERQNVLSVLSSDVRMCDPPSHVKHVTYERLTHFIQGFVENEDILRSPRTCDGTCSSVGEKDIAIRKTDSKKTYFLEGKVYDCRVAPYFDHIYKQSSPPDDERLYSFFSNEKHNPHILFGKILTPDEMLVQKIYRDEMLNTNETAITKNCQLCLCEIDRGHTKNATRAFSRAAVFVPDGNVVTGIRWVVKNHTVRLELQGMMYSAEKLYPSTRKWYTEQDSENLAPIYLDEKHRSMCLDDVKLPDKSLVKGAKFIIKDGLICVSVFSSVLDENQVLHDRTGLWYSRMNETALNKIELKLNEVDASELAPSGTVEANEDLTASGNFYMKFQPTDFKKDAAQTTVPYLDIQEVVTDPPIPIQGLGIYYKGVEGYGGFFALKLFTVNFNNSINFANIDREFEKINAIISFYKKTV